MTTRITFTLHELIGALDGYADRVLGERYGVSFNHFVFLAVLADVEPTDMTTLAQCLGITKAAVSKRVPALEAGGWITSESGPGRSILLRLTERGAEFARDAGAMLEREFAELLAHPALADDPIDVPRLDRQLSALAALIRSNPLPPLDPTCATTITTVVNQAAITQGDPS